MCAHIYTYTLRDVTKRNMSSENYTESSSHHGEKQNVQSNGEESTNSSPLTLFSKP